ncbi:hypothetical protein KM043_015781 [Ampulex compressa]|nr:hypothetical protein KM043_015781 [Ampulex compressa]
MRSSKEIKTLRLDNGMEYKSKAFERFLRDEGIEHQLSVEYTPEQNGNRHPSTVLNGRTPYEIWHQNCPNVKQLRTFGTKLYSLDKLPGKRKFDLGLKVAIIVRYSFQEKAYRIWHSQKRRVFRSRDVQFAEPLGQTDKIDDFVKEILDSVMETRPNDVKIMFTEKTSTHDDNVDENLSAGEDEDESANEENGTVPTASLIDFSESKTEQEAVISSEAEEWKRATLAE